MQGIFNHEKSGYKYKIIDFKQNNGNVEKFVYVNKNGKPIKDKDNYIYLNKNTGDIITGNGKKYVVNRLTKQLAITPTGYKLEENNNNSFELPRRMASLSIAPTNQQNSQQAPAGMMRDIKGLPPGGFIGNRLPISHVFVPKGSNNLSYSGSMFTSGPAPPSKLVPTVNAKNVLQKKTFKPGFRS
jgi:hypothetical protein